MLGTGLVRAGGFEETGLDEGVGPVLLNAACCCSVVALVMVRVSLVISTPPDAGTAMKQRLKARIGGLSALLSAEKNKEITILVLAKC